MILNGVTRDSHHLHIPLSELWHQLGHTTELCGAYWGVVCWVGEKDAPPEVEKNI